jgi:hypothetical protein
LQLYGVNDISQVETHTAEPLVLQSNASETEVAIKMVKKYELPSTDQITAEMIV